MADDDTRLTALFDSAHPAFDVVLRGYDRGQVDRHVAGLEGAVRQATAQLGDLEAQVGALRAELAQAHRLLQEAERPSYSGLGARIEQLLRLAEEQASELVAQARAEAAQLVAGARVDAAELRAGAETDAAELRALAKREADELRAT
ncbi:MAG: DivIVA domain-containing protein, partial [Actinomycetota bacterium]